MKYSDLLLDPRWNIKRKKILKRARYTCKRCKDKDVELHVHHTLYIWNRNPWDYLNKYLITLCKNCHKIVHDTEVIKVYRTEPVEKSRTIFKKKKKEESIEKLWTDFVYKVTKSMRKQKKKRPNTIKNCKT